jgi:RNA polymerase sigma-70 factor, ECF subfamily
MTQSMSPSDDELLRLVALGQEEAFARLYRRHQGALYRFALLMSGSAALAEDVIQETFLFLLREGQRYDPARGSLAAYLYGVTRNYVLRRLERERPFVPFNSTANNEVEDNEMEMPAPLVADDDPFRDCTRREVARLVRQAVLTLPPRYREVVVLCDFQELSYAEAAAALGCAVGTVSSRLHRGHALLLSRLRARDKLDPTTLATDLLRCFT